ncbi:peptidyl-prolyl cis-trans isomerase D-like [Ctenocephalides felis]|uniref:peptidyl-prolyl cis-trans isomerase D-like n=1 Tax=Ctenocephalides felis TaxID=7515 RepID=UPI000E6E49A3|nr:peptidyl-prolyl cis-trans isomerase D-like [Ctenocephalides felis]
MIQTGDFVNNDGTNGESIYGLTFDDENFELSHVEGVLSMANAGPNSNNSQFIITTVVSSHLDGTNVVFGRVLRGLGIVKEIEKLETDANGKPIKTCIIDDCGEIAQGERWGFEDNDITNDSLPPWPDDWDYDEITKKEVLENKIANIKLAGNMLYSQNDFIHSARKYKKARRYIEYMLAATDLKCEFDKEKFNHVYLLCLLNGAAVYIKLGDFKEANNLCNEALKRDPNNCKAFYRRGQAQIGLKNYDSGLEDLKRALTLFPNNKSISQEYEKALLIQRKYHILKLWFY